MDYVGNHVLGVASTAVLTISGRGCDLVSLPKVFGEAQPRLSAKAYMGL